MLKLISTEEETQVSQHADFDKNRNLSLRWVEEKYKLRSQERQNRTYIRFREHMMVKAHQDAVEFSLQTPWPMGIHAYRLNFNMPYQEFRSSFTGLYRQFGEMLDRAWDRFGE